MNLVVDGVKCEGFLCGDCNIYNRGIKQEGGENIPLRQIISEFTCSVLQVFLR